MQLESLEEAAVKISRKLEKVRAGLEIQELNEQARALMPKNLVINLDPLGTIAAKLIEWEGSLSRGETQIADLLRQIEAYNAAVVTIKKGLKHPSPARRFISYVAALWVQATTNPKNLGTLQPDNGTPLQVEAMPLLKGDTTELKGWLKDIYSIGNPAGVTLHTGKAGPLRLLRFVEAIIKAFSQGTLSFTVTTTSGTVVTSDEWLGLLLKPLQGVSLAKLEDAFTLHYDKLATLAKESRKQTKALVEGCVARAEEELMRVVTRVAGPTATKGFVLNSEHIQQWVKDQRSALVDQVMAGNYLVQVSPEQFSSWMAQARGPLLTLADWKAVIKDTLRHYGIKG